MRNPARATRICISRFQPYVCFLHAELIERIATNGAERTTCRCISRRKGDGAINPRRRPGENLLEVHAARVRVRLACASRSRNHIARRSIGLTSRSINSGQSLPSPSRKTTRFRFGEKRANACRARTAVPARRSVMTRAPAACARSAVRSRAAVVDDDHFVRQSSR